MDLKDKVVVVTGASSGIGREFARVLVGRGSRVFGLARGEGKLNDLQEELGDRFKPVRCDVQDEASVKQAFSAILKDAGRIDALINNAGIGLFGEVEEIAVDEWDDLMATNVRGVFLCSRAAIPAMKEQNSKSGFGGYIINVASIAGLLGNPKMSLYNASKFAVRGFSESLMKEVRSDGIKVSCIFPGSIETDFGDSGRSTGGSTNKMTPQDIASTILHLLETGDNYLISEVTMRPLRPKG